VGGRGRRIDRAGSRLSNHINLRACTI